MIRVIFAGLMCLLSVSSFSYSMTLAAPSKCSTAVPVDSPGFCASFKTVATCYCKESGLPPLMCQDMDFLYGQMISVYKSLDQACAAQKHTSKQDCINNWNCYRKGGVDSFGKKCSSTEKACQ